MPPIPGYLIFITLVLVVLPSIATIFIRLALYQHVFLLEEKVRRLINRQSPGQKPKILEELERRFRETSKNLDQVNTAALIDQIYSQEKVWGFTCEQIDYFCRILPNLLLAFGLLGTFLGITLNAELNTKSHIFKQSAEIFASSQFPQKLSTATANLTTMQERFSESAISLAQTTKVIETSVIEVQRCTQELTNLAGDIKKANQTSIQVLELHQNNQNSLGEIIPQLKQGASSFSKAINKLDKLEQGIASKANSLTELIEVVKSYTEQLNLAIEALGDRLILNLSQQMGSNNQQVKAAITNFEEYANQLGVKFDMSKSDFIDVIHKDNETFNNEYKNVSALIVKGIIQQTEINKKGLEMLINNIQEFNQDVNNIKDEISRLRQGMEKQVEKL
ncbi:MAG: hypothetical protein RM347_005905 [Nostoc sp. ChiQUE02]|uniref:hypothetical protein n=1 Tax=Nostoc sp. ChiQUE02 TaxID=3075377 RepID=UPI002AD4182F|nr:hypothetical protein [Nostoc sp. ChiQUE02]MDZ8230339.1 hypothetical protein [Nostoc sp. ChiQUE02]